MNDQTIRDALQAVRASREKRGLPMQPPCNPDDLKRLCDESLRWFGVEPPRGYLDFLRMTDGMNENGLHVYASHPSRDAGSDVLGVAYVVAGFVEENAGHRLDREGYDGLLVFAYSSLYVHVQDIASGKFGLLPHENEPGAPQEVFDTFEDLMLDAIQRVAKPR